MTKKSRASVRLIFGIMAAVLVLNRCAENLYLTAPSGSYRDRRTRSLSYPQACPSHGPGAAGRPIQAAAAASMLWLVTGSLRVSDSESDGFVRSVASTSGPPVARAASVMAPRGPGRGYFSADGHSDGSPAVWARRRGAGLAYYDS